MRKITKRSAAIITAAVVAVGGAGAAWASWFSSKTVDVGATSGKSLPLGVEAVSLTGPALVPGKTQGITFKVTNPNSYPVKMKTFSHGDFTTTKATCDASSFVVPAGFVVPPAFYTTTIQGEKTATFTWDGFASLSADPDNDCQDAPFKVSITVDGESAAS
jgi:hypothetical protein